MTPARLARSAATIVLACALAACAPATPAPTEAPSEPAGPIAQDVDVGGGRTIHIVCAGPTDTGRPTVVFENGAGPTLSTWSTVMNDIAATDRACAYDRAGTGLSDAPPGVRTTRDQAVDTAAALEGAGVTGSIVLVAHSRGGWNALVYTAEHPEQVAGVVLVDVAPAGLDAAWLEELPPETAGENPDITEARTIMTDHSHDVSVTTELLDLDASQAEVLAAPGFGARPTEILWAMRTGATEWPPSFDAELVERLNAVFEDLLRDIEGLAEDPTITRVDSGHAIQEERPAVVVEAIRRVLAATA